MNAIYYTPDDGKGYKINDMWKKGVDVIGTICIE